MDLKISSTYLNGDAKSLMDYIFRWLQLRFLSGQQLSLFAGLAGAVSGNGDPSPFDAPILSEHHSSTREMGEASSPKGGIVHDLGAGSESHTELRMEDRGVFQHPSDAMREYMDMGDAPSCQTCGAIMVRNGSCYRCMSCGSTSGCS